VFLNRWHINGNLQPHPTSTGRLCFEGRATRTGTIVPDNCPLAHSPSGEFQFFRLPGTSRLHLSLPPPQPVWRDVLAPFPVSRRECRFLDSSLVVVVYVCSHPQSVITAPERTAKFAPVIHLVEGYSRHLDRSACRHTVSDCGCTLPRSRTPQSHHLIPERSTSIVKST